MEPERIHPGFVSVNRDSGKDTLIYLIFVSFGSLLSFLVLFLHVRQFIKCIFNSARKRSCLERPLAILWTRDWDVRDGYCDV